MSNRRLPEAVIADLRNIIRKAADELRNGNPEGATSPEIVEHVHERAVRLCQGFVGMMVDELVARAIPGTLGSKRKDEPGETFQPMLLGLELPEFFSVPRDVGLPRWKFNADCTPNDLLNVASHRLSEIQGRQVEHQKILTLRETALRRGCGPNQPISSVFPDEVGDD